MQVYNTLDVWFPDFSDRLLFPKEYKISKERNISKTERFHDQEQTWAATQFGPTDIAIL